MHLLTSSGIACTILSQVASLEASLHAADSRARAECFEKDELAKQLHTTRQQLEATTAELRARIKECGQLPELRANLLRTQGMLQELTAAHSDLKVGACCSGRWHALQSCQLRPVATDAGGSCEDRCVVYCCCPYYAFQLSKW